MKYFVSLIGVVCSAALAFGQHVPTTSGQFSSVTDIDDLALIYIGAQHRPDWNKEKLMPYVMHTYADGTKSWKFDGFLMLDFMRWNNECKAVNLGEYIGGESTKEDWSAMLDEQLGTYTGNGCRALDNLIGELIPELGKPGHKHKVVMCMPSNWTKGDWVWGIVDGDTITGDQRVEAAKWYVDEVLRRWHDADFKNIELDGIY